MQRSGSWMDGWGVMMDQCELPAWRLPPQMIFDFRSKPPVVPVFKQETKEREKEKGREMDLMFGAN